MLRVTVKNNDGHIRTLKFQIWQYEKEHKFCLANGKISRTKIPFKSPRFDMRKFHMIQVDNVFLDYIRWVIEEYDPNFGKYYIYNIYSPWFWSNLQWKFLSVEQFGLGK